MEVLCRFVQVNGYFVHVKEDAFETAQILDAYHGGKGHVSGGVESVVAVKKDLANSGQAGC